MLNETLINATNSSNFQTSMNSPVIYYFLPIYAILFLIGTFGNGLVIISIFRASRLRTVTNTYLLNIAIADFLLLLSVPFLIVTILANGWIFGNILCKMYYNFIHINQYVSSLLLAALSFDRYLAVCHPVRAIQFRTRTNCVLIIAGCWLVSVLFLCPTWVFATVTSERVTYWLGYRVERCVIDFPAIIFTIPPEIVFTYYAFLLGFLFPVSMITTFYILVLIRLHHIRRKHRSQLKQRSHRKVTRIVLAVITAYFICWVPYWFLQIFITIDPLIISLRLNFSILPANTNMRFLKELTHLTTMMGYANNCLNPVLYIFLSDSFREEYLLVLNCFRSRQIKSNSLSNRSSREKKSKGSQRKSFILRKRQEIAMKKVKHSVAIDDVPSEYHRSFSLHIRRLSDQKCHSSPIPIQITEYEEDNLEQTPFSYSTPITRDKPLIERLPATTFADSTYLSKSIIDDGGVYCGD